MNIFLKAASIMTIRHIVSIGKKSRILFVQGLLIGQVVSQPSPTTSAKSNETTGGIMTFNYKNHDDTFWKKHLPPETYNICRQQGTEPARSGKYDKFYENGTYYCACCGGDHAVFKSDTKF